MKKQERVEELMGMGVGEESAQNIAASELGEDPKTGGPELLSLAEIPPTKGRKTRTLVSVYARRDFGENTSAEEVMDRLGCVDGRTRTLAPGEWYHAFDVLFAGEAVVVTDTYRVD